MAPVRPMRPVMYLVIPVKKANLRTTGHLKWHKMF